MPTKRRFIIFLIVLALMLLIKRAVGQEQVGGWDSTSCFGCEPSAADQAIGSAMVGGIVGILVGGCRVIERSAAAAQGRYFTGDLVLLRIQ